MNSAIIKKPVYLDYQATTPLDPNVLEAMLPFFNEKFGNPHSTSHRFGWEAAAAIDVARTNIADVIGAEKDNIIFTSGATEANNLAVKGIMSAFGSKKNHMVTVVSEHKCLLEAARKVARQMGISVTYLPIQKDGLINVSDLRKAMNDKTALVSVMAVNNEIGVIQPLAEIGAIAREKGAFFHTDAAQAFGKIPLNVAAMNIDLMSISAHKAYGPKGIGALYVGRKSKRIIVPQMDGGGQEEGLRSGTLSPALCVGFGKAAAIAKECQRAEERKIRTLSATFRGRLLMNCKSVKINGSLDHRFAGNLNISFPGIDGDKLISALRDIAVSSGAACASATSGPSYVLEAIGLSEADIKSSIRVGFGRFTSEDEVVYAADLIASVIKNMQR